MSKARDPRIDPRNGDAIWFDKPEGFTNWSSVQLVDARVGTVLHEMDDGRYIVSTLAGWREFASAATRVCHGD